MHLVLGLSVLVQGVLVFFLHLGYINLAVRCCFLRTGSEWTSRSASAVRKLGCVG